MGFSTRRYWWTQPFRSLCSRPFTHSGNHGSRSANVARVIEIASVAESASARLDADRSEVYVDLIYDSIGEAARLALRKMDAQTYEFRSEFARRYIARGKASGRAEGRANCAALIMRQLTVRFGELDAQSHARIQDASFEELTAIGERVLTARTLQEAVEPLAGVDPRP
jgi:hypothetical protein